MSIRTWCASVALFVVAADAAAQVALPEGVTRGPEMQGISEYRFPNGLHALLFPDRAKPTITVNVVYLVGSRHENYGETGMAHLLEHMLFKGTARRTNLAEEFPAHGASRNATTSIDRTSYFETFPASDDNLRWALDLESDRMVNSRLDRADFDSEMTVVRNEFERNENDTASVLGRRLQSVAFDWHNYQNATIGNRSDIEHVGIDNLRAFYRTYYQPDDAVLVVAGRFDPAFALREIAKTFGRIPKPTRALPKLWTVEPVQDGERYFAVRRPGGNPIVAFAYKSAAGRSRDYPALLVASQILTDVPGGRLHAALVETGKAAHVASGIDDSFDPGLMRFMATLQPDGSTEEGRAIIQKVIEGFAASPPTEEEMKRAQSVLALAREKTFNSTETFAVHIAGSIALGDWRLFFHDSDRVAKLTPQDVQHAAARYFRRDNRTVGVFIPTDNAERAEIAETLPAQTLLADYKPAPQTRATAEFDPSPAHINAGTRIVRLPVGMQVALLPKPTRGQAVHVRLDLRYGNLESLRGKAPVIGMMGALLVRGTSTMTRQQIRDRFNELKTSASLMGASNTLVTSRDHLPEALAVAAHLLREASFPEAEVEQLRATIRAGLEARRTNPGVMAAERLGRHANIFAPDDPRYVPSTDELLAWLPTVKREDIVALHRNQLGASHAQLAIVGDFDPDAILPVIEREFGGWSSATPYKRLESVYRPVEPLDDILRIPGKASATFIATLWMKTRDEDWIAHPEWPALVLANYILGGTPDTSRLYKRIRGKEGLSYGVGTSLSNNALDEVSTFTASATAAPENMARVERAFREELARLNSEGVTAEELAAAKKAYLAQRAQSRAQDANLALLWADKLWRGKNFDETIEYERRIDAVTLQEVLKAVRTHLDPAKLSVVKAGTLEGPMPRLSDLRP